MSEAKLYVTEWTNPADGTKRRPLVERLPEIRPWCVIWLAGLSPTWDCYYPNPVAAALCRCAVEDWLGEECHWALHLQYDAGEFHVYDRRACFDPTSEAGTLDARWSGTGPTIHHALVHAAHSVADEMGIEH